jgi:hypothetical protein
MLIVAGSLFVIMLLFLIGFIVSCRLKKKPTSDQDIYVDEPETIPLSVSSQQQRRNQAKSD